ncbi:guanine nucleotide-binding protein-like 1 [Uranotaenia lowii]|uniref:guanine nucleotide-binding protein-like 1 n=1 Tax=Uranotaenia lowii TaxID=190385 RepID=UPI00247AF766|nr:guanine nucleotide-binding protein-like 1 [Uranotaenia lowii]XP_055599357.1 guanine nucleotide-binding protein-like 1 [Uranotaenia lowii]XP_055599358.1 guanine nucleotide-binding protein-like 1 [Uranotaenia lowii]
MPQGRRKTPFSGKQKKQQLLAKKQAKSSTSHNIIRKLRDEESSDISEDSDFPLHEKVERINLQPIKDPRSKANRYVLQFHRETGKELREMKEEARKALVPCPPAETELGDGYFTGYDFPKRPKWTYEMSKEQLDANENLYFFKYITYLEKTHFDDMKSLSFCELNLETWRQLWRVLELSDIVLIIVDARFPTLMFPPSLYYYVTECIGKSMILVLNKIDLVLPEVVLGWKRYFQEKYKNIKIVMFTSYPSYNLRDKHANKHGLQIRRRKGRMRMAAEGAQQIFNICREYAGDEVDLSSWQQKILEERSVPMDIDGDFDEPIESERTHEEEKDFSFEEHVRFQDGVLTIGCVGFPNVGKSSLLNAVMGKKVVSVSRTPGHTKHFQTIFLTNTVRLCDCPGLVFPSSIPRKLQVLMGSYPIAQLREPYASIKFLAERVNLVALLALKHPDNESCEEWSAIDVCDTWALKRGFLTAKAARPDTYRGANSILRMALDGKITLSLKPIGFHQAVERLQADPELATVREIQALSDLGDKEDDDDYLSDTDTEDIAGAASNDADNEEDEDGNSTLSPGPSSTTINPFELLGSPE